MKKFLITSAIVVAITSASVFYANSVKAGEVPRDKQSQSGSKGITAPEKPANASSDTQIKAPVVSPDNKMFTESLPNDIILGEKTAPVKIIEYASLSCIHCKHFHDEVFYELKKRFIDTGKVQFTFRHFPLNAPAIKGALITGCAPEDSKQAYIGALFKSQSQWAFMNNEGEMKDKLKTVAKIGGMDDETFDKCFSDSAKQDEILALMKRANEELGVETTPSIFIDGVRFDGARTIESFSEAINEKLQKAKK